MTTPRYIEKLTQGPSPLQAERVRLALRYTPAKAARTNTRETAETLREVFGALVALTKRGFLDAKGLEAVVEVSAPDVLEVRLYAEHLPADLIVIALRLVTSVNDNIPADFQRLRDALDGDMETVLQAWRRSPGSS